MAMEKPSSNGGTLFHLFMLLQLVFCFKPPSSSSAAAADSSPSQTQFFVNCGSTAGVNADNRNFAADNSPKNFKLSRGSEATVSGEGAPASSIYQTARIFTKQSWYEFPVDGNSIYLLRLHFAAFSSHLKAARFDVSTSSFSLLRNFTAANSTAASPSISEFYLPAGAGGASPNLRVYFIPAASSPALAFVSAIELLPLSPNFYSDNRSMAVLPDGGAAPFSGFRSSALRTVHRVDVGGGRGEIYNDSLWRPWRPDQEFYATPSVGNVADTPDSRADWVQDLAASELALRSCRFERMSNGEANPANLTWRFQVEKNAMQFLRFYFLSCVADAAIRKFNLYINTNFLAEIDPSENAVQSAPYYREFVANSSGSGYFDISISPSIADENGISTAAYLNALEIMEFLPTTTVSDTDIDNNGGHPNSRWNLVIGLSAVAGAVVVLILAAMAFQLKKTKKNKIKAASDSAKKSSTGNKKSHSWMTVNTDNTTIGGSPLPELNLKLKMALPEILAATENFNPNLLIGSGGFGKVYEGKLANGVKVAVKRSESGHGQGLPEFQTEVLVLSKIRHRHLVSLIGYCDDGAEMILVYEFMKNGTLRDHLYKSDDPGSSPSSSTTTPSMNWKQRLEICIGSAKGLHYLHTGSDGGILHRDVKSTNILLDENYVAKVADFGLSQSGPPDPDHHSLALKGSFGYLDPEFFRTLQLTDKSDVYAFGVVLLEVICARPAIVNSTKREEINLAEWGMTWQKRGEIEKIVDRSILGEMNPSSLRKFVEVAEKCLRADGVDRPTMLDVCWDLEYALQLQQSTPVRREPSDDSMMDGGSSNIIRPLVGGLGDTSSFIVDDDDGLSIGDDSSSNVAVDWR